MIEVVAPGPLTLVEDLGRPGWSHVGVGPSGAFDRGALRLANRLVGNAEDAAGLEALGGGLLVEALAPVLVAVAGAEGPLLLHGRAGAPRPVGRRSPLRLDAGQRLELGHPSSGLRSYLAVRGGVASTRTFGSASRDTLAGLGPAPLGAGDRLTAGDAAVSQPHVEHAALRPRSGPLRVVAGPRDHWFVEDALRTLTTAGWTVTPSSDRVGVRLAGPVLGRRRRGAELPSEPVVTGALQVPPDGLPVLLGPDRPTTGGYPVIAVLVDDDVDLTAQLRPGDVVRFRLS